MTATQLSRLNTANDANGGRLFSGTIALEDTLSNLSGLSAATLASASSYKLTDATGNAGVIVSTHENISVATADVRLQQV